MDKTVLRPIDLPGSDLALARTVYDRCEFILANLIRNLESEEYGACSFELNGRAIQYRVSKTTPTKPGQFVTVWKRNAEGITEPYNISDRLDFIVITSRRGNDVGQFIFPRSILADQGVLTANGKVGKRGIRVYPPWDFPTNKQAAKTQRWQTQYFVTIQGDNPTDLNVIKELLTKQ